MGMPGIIGVAPVGAVCVQVAAKTSGSQHCPPLITHSSGPFMQICTEMQFSEAELFIWTP